MIRSAIAFVLLLACSSPPPATDTAATPEPAPATAAPEPAPEPEPASPTAAPTNGLKADASECNAASECASGVCEGEGCDVPGYCVPVLRTCTKDLQKFCSCDGKTVSGSSSCPRTRFSKRGPC
jgi:hypothetical protein